MKKLTISQVLIWITQLAIIGFTLPTIIGFINSPNRILTLEGSYFLIPIIVGLIGFSVIGESVAMIVIGLTGFILLIMLLCVIFFKRALKYGVFLFAVLLLDLTTMFAWYKGEVFEVSYVTTSFYIHVVVMAILIAGMIAAYFVRVEKQKAEIEMEEQAETEVEFEIKDKLSEPTMTEVEFEVEDKLSDPIAEPKENTDDSVSSDS
jgi:hypothetical protein